MFLLKLSEWSLLFSFRCFIPNIYAALFTAALIPLMCLVVVFVVFIHAYQVKPQWKAYDDVFRGRTNAAGLEGIVFVLWRWEFFNGGGNGAAIFLSRKREKLDSAFSCSLRCLLLLSTPWDLSLSLGLCRFYCWSQFCLFKILMSKEMSHTAFGSCLPNLPSTSAVITYVQPVKCIHFFLRIWEFVTNFHCAQECCVLHVEFCLCWQMFKNICDPTAS